jgi:hypothetical protein
LYGYVGGNPLRGIDPFGLVTVNTNALPTQVVDNDTLRNKVFPSGPARFFVRRKHILDEIIGIRGRNRELANGDPAKKGLIRSIERVEAVPRILTQVRRLRVDRSVRGVRQSVESKFTHRWPL